MDVLGSRVTVALVTAAAMSPRVRGMMRSGLVYGLAGLIRIGEGAVALSRDAVEEVGRTAAGTVTDVRDVVHREPAVRPPARKPRAKAAA